MVQLCMILAIFACHCDAVDFKCVYSVEDWVIIDKVYGCSVGNLTVEKGDQTLVSVFGKHIGKKTNNDVEALNVENATCTKLPKEMEKSFPNLKALRFSKTNLESIGSDDLKVFPDLRVLCLWANWLTTLDGNLLVHNPNLEFLNFGTNQIQHIGPNFFAPLKKIVAVYFEDNTCINNTRPFAIDELKFELSVKCPPTIDMVEITLYNTGKLASKNDELTQKIQLLENRINQLEEHARK